MTDIRKQVHKEVERMTEGEVLGLKKFLATYPDRLGAILRNAPWDDEPWTEEDERAWAEADKWLRENGGRGVPHEEVFRRHGLR